VSDFPLYQALAISPILGDENFAIFLRKDLIIQAQIRYSVDIGEIEVKALFEQITALSNGKKYPMMIIYSDFDSFTKEALILFASHTFTTAEALVSIDNWGMSIMANHYVKRFNPIRPTQFFTKPEEAIIWLSSFHEL